MRVSSTAARRVRGAAGANRRAISVPAKVRHLQEFLPACRRDAVARRNRRRCARVGLQTKRNCHERSTLGTGVDALQRLLRRDVSAAAGYLPILSPPIGTGLHAASAFLWAAVGRRNETNAYAVSTYRRLPGSRIPIRTQIILDK